MDTEPTAKPEDNKPLINTNKSGSLRQFTVILLILVSIASGFLGGWLGASSRDHQAGVDITRQAEIIDNESELISQVAERVGESVVSVNVTSVDQYNGFFGLEQFEQASAGTGIILNEEGIIITNRHVIPANVSQVSVVLSDGTELENVEVIGRTSDADPLDIAFLRVTDREGKDLQPAAIGNSSDVEVGDKVIAIGNALGQFANTVTSGIISGYGRSVVAGDASGSQAETLQNLFQTDAAINQGNSGGPLVDVNGRVIGINTAVAGRGENIGFAIPIDDVKGLIASVLDGGGLERPYLGVRYISLTDDIAQANQLSVNRGAYVLPDSQTGGQSSVLPNSPAAKAGLQPGDVITKVNGTNVDERHSLTSLIGRNKVGEQITLTIVRGNQTQDTQVTLEAQS